MTKNVIRYCSDVVIVIFLLQLIACQTIDEPSVKTTLQVAPGTIVETPSVVQSTALAEKTITPDPATTLTVIPLPSIPPTSTPSPIPTATPKPDLVFQLAFTAQTEEENAHGIWVYSNETQKSTLLVMASPNTHIDPIIQLRPDKAAIGYTVSEADGTWAVWEVEIASGEIKQLTPFFSLSEYYGFLEGWSPDQQWLYIRLRDTTALQEEHQITFNLDTQESIEVDDFVLAWSPVVPNRYISTGEDNERRILKVADIGGNVLTFQTPKQTRPLFARWSSDEQKVVVGFLELDETSFFILDLKTGQWQPAVTGSRSMWVTGWSSDGKWVAFDDGANLVFFDNWEPTTATISEPDFDQITSVNWLDSTTFLFKMTGNLYAVNPELSESVVELFQLNELYPNLDPFTHFIAWAP